MKSRIAASTSRSTASGSRRAAIASMSRRWYALSSLSASSERPVRSAGGPGQRPHTHATERRHPAERLGRLEHPVALDAPVHLGPLPELVGEVHLVPAGDAARGHAGVEQLVGAVQERVQRLGLVALLERAVGELGEVPRRRGALEVVAQPQPRLADVDLRHDVERPPPRERHAQLRERLERAAEARRRPPDPLRDRLELAVVRRDQRQDAVGLAQVEPREDDGVGDVSTGRGH